MDGKLVNHILAYQDIYRFISVSNRTEMELRQFLESKGKAESTVRTFMDRISKKDNPALLHLKDGIVSMDMVKARSLVDEFIEILGLPDDNELLAMAVKNAEALEDEKVQLLEQIEVEKQIVADSYEEKLRQLQVQLDEKEKELEEKDVLIKKSRSETAKMKRERNKLKKQVDGKIDFIYQSLNQKVLMLDSIGIVPEPVADEMALLTDVRPLINVENNIAEAGGERVPFYESDVVVTESMELTEENHRRRSIKRILTDLLLKKRKEDVVEDSVVEPVDAPTEEPVTQIDSFRKKRMSYIQSIADAKNMTNQEKLALYAFYSDFHGKDMEKLLNYAGDNNINANMLIEILESPGRACSTKNVENMLRQFVKPSLVRAKLDFAKEMLAGNWYIVADYNGHKTRFQLVPVEELNEIRKALDLPECKCIYEEKKVEASVEEEPVKKSEMTKAEMDRYNCLDEPDENIPDMEDITEKDEEDKNVE